MIGTHVKHLQLKGTNILVRTGGGYMQFDDYLKYCSRGECLDLHALMRKGDGTLRTAVVNLLSKHKTDKDDNKAAKRYEKLC